MSSSLCFSSPYKAIFSPHINPCPDCPGNKYRGTDTQAGQEPGLGDCHQSRGERQECSCPQTRELRTISQSSQSPVSLCPELAGLFVLVVERRGWVFLLFMFKWYTTMIYLYLRAEIERQLSLTKGSCLLKKLTNKLDHNS